MHLDFGTPKINFPFGTKGNLLSLGVSVLRHVMVLSGEATIPFSFCVLVLRRVLLLNKKKMLLQCSF